MTIQGAKYTTPIIDVKVVRGFSPEIATILRSHITHLEVEENRKLVDKMTMHIDNSSIDLFDHEDAVLGITIEVAFGYPGLLSAPRTFEVRKIEGAALRWWQGSRLKARTSKEGRVVLVGLAKAHKMHLEAGRGSPSNERQMVFENMTVPQMAERIARRYGYTNNTAAGNLHVEHKRSDVVQAQIIIPASKTDAQWLTYWARRLAYDFAVDERGFHFHSPQFRRYETVRYFSGDPDVISWEIEGSLDFPCRVTGRAVDTSRGGIEVFTYEAEAEESGNSTPRQSSSGARGLGADAPQQNEGTGVGVPGVASFIPRRIRGECYGREYVTTGRGRERLLQQINKKLKRQQDKWKLKVRLVGNPKVRARNWLNLHNFGELIDAPWYVGVARHVIEPSGVYTTDVEASLVAPGGGRGRISIEVGNYVGVGEENQDVPGVWSFTETDNRQSLIPRP